MVRRHTRLSEGRVPAARLDGDVLQAYALKLSVRLRAKSRVFLFWKGRVALYALLRAMGVGAGDEVVLSAYTCVVVPNAVFYCGAVPQYVDVAPQTYCMDVRDVEKALGPRTKVVLCQNTYGLSANVEEISGLARSRGIYTIEDCAHGFGGSFRGKPNGSFCDAAFFSTQWNKPFSTGLGGFALVNDEALHGRMQSVENEQCRPSFQEVWWLRLLLGIRPWLVREQTYWKAVALYRLLSRYNLVLGSSQSSEIRDTTMPRNYLKGLSEVQARAGLKALNHLDETIRLRKRNADLYTTFLAKHGRNHVPHAFFRDHAFLKYPLLVKDRRALQAAAEEAHIPLGDWFFSPLHPVTKGLEKWNYRVGDYPVAERLARTVVNLPTDTSHPEKVVSFLARHLELIEAV